MALLAYLAMIEQPQPRDGLATLLWRDTNNRQARKQLSNVLSDLKKVMGDYLIIERQQIQLNPNKQIWTDARVFQRYIHSAESQSDPQVSTRFLDLYMDDFLAGFSVRNATGFEEWQISQQQELRSLAVQAAMRVTEQHLQRGEYIPGLSAANRWLHLEPETEAAHRQKMRLLFYNDQRTAALAQYEICGQMLADEFGVEPSDETQQIYEQIRTGTLPPVVPTGAIAEASINRHESPIWPSNTMAMDQSPKGQADATFPRGVQQPRKSLLAKSLPPKNHTAMGQAQEVQLIPGNLPLYLTRFVGRQAEAQHIEERLALSACRLLTIMGIGGVGKTRLAIEVCHSLKDGGGGSLFRDGIYLVELPEIDMPGTDTERADALLTTISQTLQLPQQPQDVSIEQKRDRLTAWLEDKKLLLILDNMEYFSSEGALLMQLLQKAKGLKFLITSRKRLHVDCEWLLHLEGLDVHTASDTGQTKSQRPPARVSATNPESNSSEEGMSSGSAEELFLTLARQVDHHFSMEDGTQRAISTICQWLEGLPLGIELAASWMAILDCETAIELLSQDLDSLIFPQQRQRPARHRSLAAMLEHSWRLLTPSEQETLRQLAALERPLSIYDKESTDISLPQVFSLADQSLLQTSASNKYVVHPLMQRYVLEKVC